MTRLPHAEREEYTESAAQEQLVTMPTAANQTTQIQQCLDRFRAGEAAAHDELIHCAFERLERLTRKMLGNWQRVHRWEQTGDVLQNASLRLYRAGRHAASQPRRFLPAGCAEHPA